VVQDGPVTITLPDYIRPSGMGHDEWTAEILVGWLDRHINHQEYTFG